MNNTDLHRKVTTLTTKAKCRKRLNKKNYKHLIQVIFEVKITFEIMVLKLFNIFANVQML